MRGKFSRKPRGRLDLVIPFFVALALLTVLSFCIFLRPTRSMLEKRELAKFPEFTWEALVSGDYFDDISLWFSDTFPGREGWIDLATRISSLHGTSEITISGDLPMMEEIPEVPETTAASTEATEVTVPTTEKPVTEETTEAATEAPTTEPTEPTWGGVDVEHAEEIQLGAVIQIGDTAFNSQGFSEGQSKKYARILNTLQEKVKKHGIRVVSAPAPTSVGIMVEKKYLEKMHCADQEEILKFMHSELSEDVVAVDTFNALLPHNNEYIYFRTDHHWTALGAYYSYRAICEALDYVPADLDSFEVWEQGEFKGSLTYQCARPRKLKPDYVDAYIPQGEIQHRVYNKMGIPTERTLLQDMRERDVNTKYLTFIWSDNPLSEIVNESLPDGPTCILVKDSFGNALAPFLTQNYHRILVVDYRKFNLMRLDDMAIKYKVDDIIFTPYITATQSIQGNQMMGGLCKVYT